MRVDGGVKRLLPLLVPATIRSADESVPYTVPQPLEGPKAPTRATTQSLPVWGLGLALENYLA